MTTWRRTLPTFLHEHTDLYTLGVEYPESVARAGGLPVLLPHFDPDDAHRMLEGMDAVVLVGGDDISPGLYGADDLGVSKGVRDSADACEAALVRVAYERGLPMFCICRGYQMLNVALGGTLHQDMVTDDGLHRPISDVPEEVMGERHLISIDAGSRLARAYGETQRVVNSIHHQAVERVAPGFRAVAWAEDGTIEAIEAIDDRAILAVQGHPEKITHEGDEVLFRYFMDEVSRG
jgi:putative glutamine amidotransferase